MSELLLAKVYAAKAPDYLRLIDGGIELAGSLYAEPGSVAPKGSVSNSFPFRLNLLMIVSCQRLEGPMTNGSALAA